MLAEARSRVGAHHAPVGGVAGAAGRSAGHGPAVEGVAVVLEGGRPLSARTDDVVDVRARERVDVVGDRAQREVDLVPGVRREVHRPRLVAVAPAGRRVPGARAAGRRTAAVAVVALVVGQEGVDGQPVGAAVAGAGRRVPVEVGQRGPAGRAHAMGLDGEEVPVGLVVAYDVEGQLAAGRGHREPTRQPLVARVVATGDGVLRTGAWSRLAAAVRSRRRRRTRCRRAGRT